jgi:Zn finger protein HypA/HybF involved in hydrogenase expression
MTVNTIIYIDCQDCTKNTKNLVAVSDAVTVESVILSLRCSRCSSQNVRVSVLADDLRLVKVRSQNS